MDFALHTGGDYESVLDAARWAEGIGLVSLALADHYIRSVGDDVESPTFDPFPHLAGLARETTRIGLGVYVSPVTFRHPAVLLKMAVTIDHMSGGRFSLGVGTGWLDREHEIFGIPFPERKVRFEMLEDALGYLRAALTPGAVGHEGRFFKLEAVAVAPGPIGPLRLVVGGVGSVKTPRLAGRFADEYNVYPASEDEMKARIGRARVAALAAGRDPDEILLSSSGAVLTAPTQNEYRKKFAAVARDVGIEVEELEAHFEFRNTPRGSYEQVAEQISILAAQGVQRFYLQRSANFDREEEEALIEYLRREIG